RIATALEPADPPVVGTPGQVRGCRRDHRVAEYYRHSRYALRVYQHEADVGAGVGALQLVVENHRPALPVPADPRRAEAVSRQPQHAAVAQTGPVAADRREPGGDFDRWRHIDVEAAQAAPNCDPFQ